MNLGQPLPFRGSSKKKQKKKKTQKSPRGIVLPPLRVHNILWSLTIRALACVAKDVTNFCLESKNQRSWASDHEKKNEKKRVSLDPDLTAG